MQENNRFNFVFAKMLAMLEEEGSPELDEEQASIRRTFEVTGEELDEIDKLRRIVLEVTDPVPVSWTTT